MTVFKKTQIVLGLADAIDTPTETDPPTAAALVAAYSELTDPTSSYSTSSSITSILAVD